MYEPGPFLEPARGSPSSAPTPSSCTAAPRCSRCSAAPGPLAAAVAELRGQRGRSTGGAAAARAATAARPAGARRTTARRDTCSLRSRATAGGGDRRRGVPLEPSRAARADQRARPDGLGQQRQRRPRLRHHQRDRAAHGSTARGRSSRCSATARRCTRSRRCGAPPATVSACSLIVLANGSYAVMDALARDEGGAGAWPGFGEVAISTIAEGFGCPARRIETHDELIAALDEVLPTLADARRAAPARGGGGGVNRLAGKSALITGGCGSIGLATARAFVAEGAGVFLLDLDGAALAARRRRARQRARRLRRGGRDRQPKRSPPQCDATVERFGRPRHRLRQRGRVRHGRAGHRIPRGRLRAGAAGQRVRRLPRRQARAARDAPGRQPDHQLERRRAHLRLAVSPATRPPSTRSSG